MTLKSTFHTHVWDERLLNLEIVAVFWKSWGGVHMTMKKITFVAKFHVMEGTFFEGIYTLVH